MIATCCSTTTSIHHAADRATNGAGGRQKMGGRVLGFLNRVLDMEMGGSSKVKSCGNLHVL